MISKQTSAADKNISSVMCRAAVAMTPRAKPGKIYTLFPCPGTKLRPSVRVTGENGLPLANKHAP